MKELAINERLAELSLYDIDKHIIIYKRDKSLKYEKSTDQFLEQLARNKYLNDWDYRLAPKNAESFIGLWGEKDIIKNNELFLGIDWDIDGLEVSPNSIRFIASEFDCVIDLDSEGVFEKYKEPPKQEYRPFEKNEITCNMWFREKSNIKSEDRAYGIFINEKKALIEIAGSSYSLLDLLKEWDVRLDGSKEWNKAGVKI